jgi:hypothetical protein
MGYSLSRHLPVLEEWLAALAVSTESPPNFIIPVSDDIHIESVHRAARNLIAAIRKDPDFMDGRFLPLAQLRIKKSLDKERRGHLILYPRTHFGPMSSRISPAALLGTQAHVRPKNKKEDTVIISNDGVLDMMKRIKKDFDTALASTPNDQEVVSFPFTMREDLTVQTTREEFLRYLREYVDETAGPAYDMRKKKIIFEKDSIGNFIYTIEVLNPNYDPFST